MKYPRILSALRAARWAATPPTIQAIADSLGAHLRGSIKGLPADQVAPPSAVPGSATKEDPVPQLAVIPVYGILGKHLSALETECGGCDVDAIGQAIDAAVRDTDIRAIVLDFDSPGGVVTGIPELATRIREADEQKPVYAFTGAQCCSAAYWLAASARAIFCTPTADLGSIGVYVALCDDSEWWKREGYKLELIKAGEYKAMGISGKPLSEQERALIQADVDAIYAMFTADVRLGRGQVADSTMQGQTFMGRAAIDVNLADELITDLDALLLTLDAELAAAAPRFALSSPAAKV